MIIYNEQHPSVQAIYDKIQSNNNFVFKPVTSQEVHKLLHSVDGKKATGIDNLPPKIIKAGAESLAEPIKCIINKCFINNT
jgi:hypothetical protein